MKALGVINKENLPVTRHYVALCPNCGAVVECDDSEISVVCSNDMVRLSDDTPVYRTVRSVTCPRCYERITDESLNLMLSHITDKSGKEVFKFMTVKSF